MKKILIFALIGCLLIGITGCKKELPSMKTTKKSETVTTTKNGVTLATDDDSLNGTSVTLILKNNSDKEITYDDEFEIEMEKDDGWYKLENSMTFDANTYSLAPGEEKELKIDWKEEYGRLLSGTYRIVKKVSFGAEEEKEEFYVGVIFGVIATY